jgi:hypothetical protein
MYICGRGERTIRSKEIKIRPKEGKIKPASADDWEGCTGFSCCDALYFQADIILLSIVIDGITSAGESFSHNCHVFLDWFCLLCVSVHYSIFRLWSEIGRSASSFCD